MTTPTTTTPELTPEVAAIMADLNKMVVSRYGYTRGDLDRVFHNIQNPGDWRAPIVAVVHGEDVMIVTEAITFFVGEAPTVQLNTQTMTYTITSRGYRAAQGED
jgi:hypothetical protein